MKALDARKSRKIVGQLEKMLTDVFNASKARQYINSKKMGAHSWLIGGYIIIEKPHKLYDIVYAKSKKVIYENIYCVDAAIALVENLNQNRKNAISCIEKAEKVYATSYNEIMHYKKMIQAQNPNVDIYRHRYGVSLSKLHVALREIKRYRILNFDK